MTTNHRMAQRTHNICPYTLKPLAKRGKVNEEHISPDAIGGGRTPFVGATDLGRRSRRGSRETRRTPDPVLIAPTSFSW